MTGLILRRLAQLPLILAAVYTLTLTLAWAIPGNPLENPEGRQPPAEVMEAMKRQYNLDSYWKFYFSYLYNALGVRWAHEEIVHTWAATRALSDQPSAVEAARLQDSADARRGGRRL